MHAVQKTIVGTLIFHAVTKGKIPVIKATELYGLPGALFGIIGYIASIFFGEVDFQPVLKAQYFVLPAFVRPEVCYCVSYPYNRNRKITLLI